MPRSRPIPSRPAIRSRWRRAPRPRPTRLISGCCGGCSSAASSTATRSIIRRTAASSSSNWRRTCSTSGRHGQQPDRRHEGWAGDLRRAGRRRPVALGDRRSQGQVPRQAGQATGHDPSPHGSFRRHPYLCGGRGRDRDPGPGPAVLREDASGRAHDEARRAREAAEAGEDRGREGHDDAQGRHDRGHGCSTSRTRMSTA